VFLASLGLSILQCAPTPSLPSQVPPNIRIFPKPFEEVWKVIMNVVQVDLLLPIEVSDPQKGYFSTQLVFEDQAFLKTKFRLSGTLEFDGQTTTVKLYKHQQIQELDGWKTIPSELMLEQKVLHLVEKKLRSK